MGESWDVIVIGAGPAGTAAALGALAERPRLRVLLLDRADFPRDKACGDGIAPHVLDVLASVGVAGLFDAHLPVRCLDLSYRGWRVARTLRRPAWVVPRETFDARLVEAAVHAGAELRRHKVRTVRAAGEIVTLDDDLAASVVIGADGANSLVREAAGAAPPDRKAFALRGYAPTPTGRAGRQVIAFAPVGPPAYAWSFDRGDGLANVGYGEFPDPRRPAPSKGLMLDRLDELLPGSTSDGTAWRGHHLPLSSWTWTQPDGPILLAGDAAGLINPMTGEGIYYAVATGVLAGRAAAAVSQADRDAAGARYRARVRALLASHLRHTATAARLTAIPAILGAGIRAAERDQRVFDDLVEVGLGRGLLTRRTITGLVRNSRTSV